MRISILYDIDAETVSECSRITGLEASVDKEGTGEILIGFSRLKVRENTVMIQTASAGVDHIDLSQVKGNVTVCSNAGAYSNILGEMVFALLLSHSKRIREFDRDTRQGKFKREPTGNLEGLTMGILGYGGIGAQSARIAKAFDMKTLAYTRTRKEGVNLDSYVDSPEELFERSDIILVSTPLNNATRGMVNGDLLSRFNGRYIINVARANIIEKEAMLEFLRENPDKYFLSDVWWGEPEIKDPVPENAMLTPHVGGFANTTLGDVTIKACRNVKLFLEGRPENVVDIAEYLSQV